MGWLLKKEEFNSFIGRLLKHYEVIAPVSKDGVVSFERVSHAGQIVLDRQADYPPKKYFLPSYEKLFAFSGQKVIDNRAKQKKRAIIGIRKCDIDALAVLDKVFLEEPKDGLYEQKRKNTLIIGIACQKPFGGCFCSNKQPFGKFDIMLMETKGGFYAEAGSKAGKRIMRGFERKNTRISYANCRERIREKNLMPYFNRKRWDAYAEKCLACGSCTAVCPTCGCFEIADRLNLDLRSGARIKSESSCMLPCFTRVAGGFVFRKEIAARYKHRIYHKLQYFKEKHGISMCTGCGRCKRMCPVDICDLPKIVRELK